MDVKHRMIVFDAADIDVESAFWGAFLDGRVEEWAARGGRSGSTAGGHSVCSTLPTTYR
ncbi:hypothetical protein JOF29_001216 [Kribbella aluminosa]|uniref:Glyoxalase-like domain-containing protein n=1 Tax=Kribbella aluminosa TaxID=416017 RepID=A0ABS4UEU2_9ACTN|nr:hypothetical protein [Kribbella aluminosa]MBP2350133.1 hypothetical protein [Kribbella aluminosa]